MARFGRAPGMRNMATFGMLDENRHTQLQLFFPHSYCPKDRQFDWAFKAYDTNEWGAIAARHYFDDMMNTRGADMRDTVAEMAERIASASSNSGIGLTLLPVFYAHSSFGGAAPNAGQRLFINNLDQFERLLNQSAQTLNQLANANIGIAPHSLRAVTPEELAALVTMASTLLTL